MKSICLYAHYDPDGIINSDDLNTITLLSKIFDKINIITSNNLDNLKLPDNAEIILNCPNYGIDFGKFEYYLRSNYDSIIKGYNKFCLTNNSYLSCRDFKNSIDYMAKKNCDWWGYTSSLERKLHVQSYFLYFNNIETFNEFKNLLFKISPLSNKLDYNKSVELLEINFLSHMNSKKFKSAAYIKTHKIFGNENPVLFHADKLLILNHDFPIIKKKCYTEYNFITKFTKEKLLEIAKG